jgi:hypothetical protein
VGGCRDHPGCVRVSHLTLIETFRRSGRRRAPRGSGTKTRVRPGVWTLTVTAGRYADGTVRREHRTVRVRTEAEANRELATFASEVRSERELPDRSRRDLSIDEGIEPFLTEYLLGEKGREKTTVDDYRAVHPKWFSSEIGHQRIRDVDEAAIDRIFGRMRNAGRSRSRMQAARNLYRPFFRWAKRRRIVRHNPMSDFELPTSMHVPRERVLPMRSSSPHISRPQWNTSRRSRPS